MRPSVKNEDISNARFNVIPDGHSSVTTTYVDTARGALLRDIEGREYIDFVGGIGVMNVGHSHPKVVAALKDQAEKFTHTCFMILPYEPAVRTAEKLCGITPGDFPKKALLINSGAEAVENAVKIARYATGKTAIIAFENAYHGRTLLTMTLTSKVKPYKYGFGPFAPEIYRMPFAYCYRCAFGLDYPDCGVACAEHLRTFLINHVSPEATAALVVEPIQGEGGFITPPKEYFAKLHQICREHDILLIVDEIQSGMGRTGKMFAIEHWGVSPDLIVVAKSLAAGMPLSAVVGRKEVMDKVHPWGLGGTYGGNPLACRAALAVMDIVETENILERATVLGQTLRNRLEQWKETFDIIGDVRGAGPMVAIELVNDRLNKTPAVKETQKLVQFCHERGLIINACGTFGNVVRFLMPLIIDEDLLERGLTIVERGLNTLT